MMPHGDQAKGNDTLLANGRSLVERFNAVLKRCLRRQRSEQPRQGHRYILFVYREVPQELTRFAPFELFYKGTIRGPMHILREL
ncbi:Zinc finger protein [Plakobranchus ocellatus]|uniref:Zinc finger protein n=1 Tax=Plakobranchus ocellatus TaxID=259542 RepID=A0AAV3Y9J2_9GAST|nr:Zinc finger protein [Plakobranchus ocellatus]